MLRKFSIMTSHHESYKAGTASVQIIRRRYAKVTSTKKVCGRQSASSAITRSNTCTRPSSRKHQLGAEQSSFFDDHVDDTLKPRLHELTILLSKSLHLRKRPL